MEEYIEQGKVKIGIQRLSPFRIFIQMPLPAAVAAECANDQNKFKGMHDALFENQKQWSNLRNIFSTINICSICKGFTFRS